MTTVDKLIKESKDVRELKRALGVKMLQEGLKPQQIAKILNVSEQFVSKWKGKHEQAGASSLCLQHRGSQGYLNDEAKAAVIKWIERRTHLSVEQLRDYLEATYDVTYRSKQSYYDLLEAGGMSYHRTIAANPKRNEAQILEKRAEIKKKWQNTKTK